MKAGTIRKGWLWSLIIGVICPLVNVAVLINILKASSSPSELFVDTISGAIANSVMGFVWGSLFAFLLFRCAFKKPGTRLLSFFIFSCWVSIIYFIYYLGQTASLSSMFKLVNQQEMSYFKNLFLKLRTLGVLNTLASLTVAYFSWKLWKLNKQEQLRVLLASPTYQSVFEEIGSAEVVDTLTESYSKWVQTYPEIAWHLKRQYKKRLEQLNV